MTQQKPTHPSFTYSVRTSMKRTLVHRDLSDACSLWMTFDDLDFSPQLRFVFRHLVLRFEKVISHRHDYYYMARVLYYFIYILLELPSCFITYRNSCIKNRGVKCEEVGTQPILFPHELFHLTRVAVLSPILEHCW